MSPVQSIELPDTLSRTGDSKNQSFIDEYLSCLDKQKSHEKKAEQDNKTTDKSIQTEFKFKGQLFLIGGAADTTWDDMISKAGKNAKVVAVGLAADDEAAAGAALGKDFENSGIKPENITVLSNQAKPQGCKYDWTDKLPDKFDLIYFGGGDQSVLKDRFKEVDKLRQALIDGATVAGNSAGSAVMPSEMISGGNAATLTHSEGFSLLPWAITDTHVHQRHREDRDVSALYDIGKGKLPVIGIDADTRVLIHWDGDRLIGEVQGHGSVRVFKPTDQDLKVESKHKVDPQITVGTDGAGKGKSALVWELKEGDKFAIR
jgi:cyanophycinase